MFILSVTSAASSLEDVEELAGAMEKKQRMYKNRGQDVVQGLGSVLTLGFSCICTNHLTSLWIQHHCLPG